MSKLYLDKDTSAYLVSLGCTSESRWWWRNDFPDNPGKYKNKWYIIPETDYPYVGLPKPIKYEKGWHLLPAFELEDLLRRENLIKIWPPEKVIQMELQCPNHGFICGGPYLKESWESYIKERKYCGKCGSENISTEKNVDSYTDHTWEILDIFQEYPDTWPEKIKELIKA